MKAHIKIIGPIIVLVFVAYFGVWNFGFVYDDSHVVSNPFNQSLSPIDKFFLEPGVYLNNPENPQVWRPLGSLTRAVSFLIFGYHASLYHLLNLAFHLLNIVLIYVLILSLTRKKWLAGLTALAIGVHPALTEAVTWISSLTTLLWAALFLATCLLIWYRKSPLLSLATFSAALLMKESAFPGVAIILALLWWQDFNDEINWRGLMKKWSPYAMAAGIYFLCRTLILPDILNFLPNSYLAIPYSIWKYAAAIFWPASLIIFEAQQKSFITPISLLDLRAIAGTLIAVGLIALLVFCFRKRWLEEFFGLFWFGVFMLPFIQVINIGVFIGTRSLYVPMIGLVLAIFGIISRIWKYRKITYAALVILLAIFISLTYIRNQDWKDGEALWKSVLRVDPNSVVARVNLAYFYLGEGQNPQKALEVSQEQLRLYPKHFGGWLTLADSYTALGEFELAKAEYLKLLRIYPGNDRVQRRWNFLYQSAEINSGILVTTAPSSNNFYFEVRSVAIKDFVVAWSEEANQEFRISLPPGEYYIRFQGADSSHFTVQKDSWFPITIKP